MADADFVNIPYGPRHDEFCQGLDTVCNCIFALLRLCHFSDVPASGFSYEAECPKGCRWNEFECRDAGLTDKGYAALRREGLSQLLKMVPVPVAPGEFPSEYDIVSLFSTANLLS